MPSGREGANGNGVNALVYFAGIVGKAGDDGHELGFSHARLRVAAKLLAEPLEVRGRSGHALLADLDLFIDGETQSTFSECLTRHFPNV